MSSNPVIIPHVIKLLQNNTPQKIMDVGAGYGKYGVLTRLYIEDVRYDPQKWHLHIDAIEVFPEYLTTTRHFYNNIYSVDARKHDISGYDMVFCFDVIEHMEKEEALAFIRKIIENNRSLILSTPYGFTEQEAAHDNEFQIHRSGFKEEDFKGLDLKVFSFSNVLFAYSAHLNYDPTMTKRLKRKIPKGLRKIALRIINPKKYKRIYEK